VKYLIFLTLALAGSQHLLAEEPFEYADEDRMEHVLVSVPIHKKAAETALPVTVLSSEELRRAAASSIGETLAGQPGLANASFGPAVGQPVIRGQQGPRVQVLQNGTSSADVSGLSPDHAVSVEALLADSIEVLRGPATLLYGGGAIGGVVNVIDNRIPTKRLDDLSGGIEYRYDDAPGLKSGVMRLEGGVDNFAFHLDGLYRDYDDMDIPGEAIDLADPAGDIENTDGYIANTDGDSHSLTLGSSYHFGDRGFFGLAVNHMESEYGIPPGAHEHEEEEPGQAEEEEFVRIDLDQTRYDAALHLHQPFNGFEVLRGFLTYTDYQHKELEGSEVGTRFERNSWESRLELVHAPLGDWHGVLGLQWRADEFEATGEEAYVPRTDSTDIGLFLLEDFHRGNWTYEGGLRLDWNERDPDSSFASSEDFSSFSISGSTIWDFADQWSAGLALARAERAPVTQELYSNVEARDINELVTHAATGVIEVGNTDLDKETSINADLTLAWDGSSHHAELTLFYNHFQDYIYLANSGLQALETDILFYDQQDTDFYGLEFDSEFMLASLAGGQILLHLFGDTISGELDDGDDVPRLPPYRLGAGLSWDMGQLKLWLEALQAADQDNPGEFETKTDGYTRWDAGVDYQLSLGGTRTLDLFVKLKNIGDEEIRLSTSFLRDVAPEAGRSVEAAIRLSF
jgi:iron complex outermembrane receptor protein